MTLLESPAKFLAIFYKIIMAVTVFIIFLFAGLILAAFLVWRFFQSKPGKDSFNVPENDQLSILMVAAFDRFSLRYIAVIILVITSLLLISACLYYDFSNLAVQAAGLILFLMIITTGFVFFLKKGYDDQNDDLGSSSNADTEGKIS